MTMRTICPDCDGQRLMPGYDCDCPRCKATGTVPLQSHAGRSASNDCWFARFYPFGSEAHAKAFEEGIQKNAATITRLTAANRALMAELASTEEDRDRIRRERGLYCLAKQRAEAKLAKVEAENLRLQNDCCFPDDDDPACKLESTFMKMVESITTERDRLSAELAEARKVIEPFSDIAGEMFLRGWDASNVALALDNPDDPHRVTAGDFFTARDFLASKGE